MGHDMDVGEGNGFSGPTTDRDGGTSISHGCYSYIHSRRTLPLIGQ